MNISLIYPLLSKSRSLIDENKQYWPPLGLAYIGAVLESNNHGVKIIDRDVILRKNKLNFERTDKLTLKEIESFDTDMVGISATTPNMGDVMHLSNLLKGRNPNLRIVLGGPHPTCASRATLEKCKNIDIVVRGEGEFTILDLANGLSLEDIQGISFRNRDALVENVDRAMCSDLDKLPYAARHLLDMEFYLRPSRFIGRGLNLRTTSVFSSRGCPYRCYFCAGHIMFPGRVRFHSPERIIGEMELLARKYSVEAIYFADDMFLSRRGRVTQFLQLLKENKTLKKIKWIAQARSNVVDEDILKALKRGGCVGLEYGFESGSQRMLDIMNKKSTVEDNLRAARLTRKAGLRFTGFIITGYPGETELDFSKTAAFLKKARPNVISLSLFYPLPGTKSYDELVSQNRKLPDWDKIGDIEAVDQNYAAIEGTKFSRLYFKTRLNLVLPNNLYYFILDNLHHPLGLLKAFFTQFKGGVIRSLRALRYLRTKSRARKRILFLSYNGVLEPLLHSQALPYMRELANRTNAKFVLLTFEKKKDIRKYGTHYIKAMRHRLENEGIEWYFLRYHKTPSLLATLFDIMNGTVFSMCLVILRRISLIHARGIVSASVAFNLHLIFHNTRYVFDMRNFLAEAYASAGRWRTDSLNFKLVKLMEGLILRRAATTVVESHHHQRALKKERGITVEVIPCCVDLNKFQCGINRAQNHFRPFGIVGNGGNLIYIGSLGTWYMKNEMLDFFKTITRDTEFADFNFIFATYYDRSLLMKAVEDKNIDVGRIKIVSLPHDKIPEVLSLGNLAIAFIKPYERADAFPTKIGEYLACGLPVIINKGMGDVEEIIQKGRAGIIIDEFTEYGYKKGIDKLKELLREGGMLNARCRKLAEDYLSLGKGVDKYNQLYRRSIA